jgi:hypothetical protein
MSKNVSNNQAFWFCNKHGWAGQIAHNLDEFTRQVKTVPIDCLEFHLRDNKNDFEAWLRDVMQENRLAKKMTKIKKEGIRGEELRKALIGLFE